MGNKKSSSSLGYGLVIASSFFYASYGIWTTLMGDFFGGYTAAALRSVVVLMIVVPFAVLTGELPSFEFGKNWRVLTGMTMVSSLIWGLFYYSVLNAGIGVSFSLNYVAIIIGMIFFGWLFAKERITQEKLLSACIGVAGLALVYITTASEGSNSLALVFAVVSGLSVAANTVLAKRLPYSTTQAVVAMWVTGMLANTPMIFILREPLPQIGLHVEWVYLAIFAFASVLSSWLMLRGMSYVDAGIAGVIGTLEIVFGIIFGVMFFDETLPTFAYLGVVVILVAAAFPYINGKYFAAS